MKAKIDCAKEPTPQRINIYKQADKKCACQFFLTNCFLNYNYNIIKKSASKPKAHKSIDFIHPYCGIYHSSNLQQGYRYGQDRPQ